MPYTSTKKKHNCMKRICRGFLAISLSLFSNNLDDSEPRTVNLAKCDSGSILCASANNSPDSALLVLYLH